MFMLEFRSAAFLPGRAFPSPCRGDRLSFGFPTLPSSDSDVELIEEESVNFTAALNQRQRLLVAAAAALWSERQTYQDTVAQVRLLFSGWVNVTLATRRRLLRLLASASFIQEKKRAREIAFGGERHGSRRRHY